MPTQSRKKIVWRPTILWVDYLHSSCLRELKSPHYRLRQNNLEGFQLLVQVITKDPDLPGGGGLAWVKLDLLLSFATEIFVFLCRAIFGSNRCRAEIVDIVALNGNQYLRNKRSFCTYCKDKNRTFLWSTPIYILPKSTNVLATPPSKHQSWGQTSVIKYCCVKGRDMTSTWERKVNQNDFGKLHLNFWTNRHYPKWDGMNFNASVHWGFPNMTKASRCQLDRGRGANFLRQLARRCTAWARW